jgi:hypothetical protein
MPKVSTKLRFTESFLRRPKNEELRSRVRSSARMFPATAVDGGGRGMDAIARARKSVIPYLFDGFGIDLLQDLGEL